ncbi:MAG: type II/IV secretion system ATPase subunit [Candidatus Lokiarchaeota archaeon]|nr:type II/IV secretion system ATPase subunit [Candidatus Lokiarchaeota archaeon]
MTSNIDELSHFQIKETIDDKEEKTLIIDCLTCSNLEEGRHFTSECINCVLKNLYLNKNSINRTTSVKRRENLIEYNQLSSMLGFFNKITPIRKIWKKIENIGKKKCRYQEFNCKLGTLYDSPFSTNTNPIYEPISFFNSTLDKLKEFKGIEVINFDCQKCIKKVLTFIENILDILNKLDIIHKYKKFSIKDSSAECIIDFYNHIVFGVPFTSITNILTKNSSITSKSDLIETYKVGKNEVFQILIFDVTNEYEKHYIVKFSFQSSGEEDFFKKIVIDAKNNLNLLNSDKIIPLEELISVYEINAKRYLISKYKLSENEIESISFVSALHKLKLEKVFPLLVDDHIEEIFLDSPKEKIYINHQKFGRCRTDITLDLKDIERLKTFLRLYSGRRLDFSNPSIKVVIKNKYFYCRFSIDVGPIQLHDFALDIRKLNKNIYTIQDLLKNGTLNHTISAFLYFLILRRVNITITGETDTGKTTLINALDLLAPKEFRKIYVENVIESLNQSEYQRHQLKYQVDSLEDQLTNQASKQNQIKYLLHRTPDIIYLGEILTKEEAEALFHCLAAGLKGFQTIHSNNIDSFLNRIIHHFKIHVSCLSDLGLLILMKKNRQRRMITSIVEMKKKKVEANKIYNTLFKFEPNLKDWSASKTLYESNLVKQIRKYEDISQDKFHFLFELYQDVFKTLRQIEKLEIFNLIELFDRLSFYSLTNVEMLPVFWENWKNSCSLNS